MNTLVSAAGRRVRLIDFFRQALARLSVASVLIACDTNPMSAALFAADDRFLIPAASEPGHIPFVLQQCRERQIGLLVSVNDMELLPYAEARDRFETQGTFVAIPSAEAVRITRDKRSTYEWFVRHGYPAPRRWPAESASSASDMGYPVIVKPAAGSAAIGVRLVTSREELVRAIAETVNPVIEEYQSGPEFTVNVLASQEGRLVCAVPHLRLETRAGEVSKGRTFRHDELDRLAHRLVEDLPSCRGPINFQGFLDAAGGVRLTEINARFGGGYPLAHAAGAQFPEWMIMERLGRPIPRDFSDWKTDMVMMRYDAEVIGRQVGPDRIEPA